MSSFKSKGNFKVTLIKQIFKKEVFRPFAIKMNNANNLMDLVLTVLLRVISDLIIVTVPSKI